MTGLKEFLEVMALVVVVVETVGLVVRSVLEIPKIFVIDGSYFFRFELLRVVC